ncbi:MAG TPA: tripartite tricarboxylate transporter permease [Methylomirabilota bacterium]|jgi:putative tricarboxylic transport membrane protein|nr:tripartite tricarboxylate transporter permease [Methylomirabilota bacterium]
MGPLEGLAYGFGVALTPGNLFACFVGVLVGTIVGVLPGIGPVGAMALLLPSTFALHPATALIMLAGIYYGAMYGGSTTSILVNVPGEAGSVVTLLDGYQMTRRGRAGAALAVAAVGSFVAGTLGVVGIMFSAAWLANAALHFGPPEYFAITLGGILLLSRLSSARLSHAFVLVAIGLGLGTVGMDTISAARRFTFGSVQLSQGVELVPVIMGLYGVAEVLVLAEEGVRRAQIARVRLREMFPTREEWRRSAAPIARGSVVGFLTGLIPGPAAVLSTFISYALEKRVSKRPEEFGKGAIEGVAGPEAANNGATAGAMVPLLSLGIPFSPATAILLGALVIQGLQPGPLMISQRPEVFWGFVASMYIGNFLLLILNLPLVGLFVSVLRLPQHVLATLVLLLCLVGAFSLNNSFLDLWILVTFGVVGYVLRQLRIDPSPLVVALVLGPMMEKTLRQSLFLTQGSVVEMLARPLTAAILIVPAAVLLGPPLVRVVRRRRAAAVSPA